jgi:trimeric autotransporter adhesin
MVRTVRKHGLTVVVAILAGMVVAGPPLAAHVTKKVKHTWRHIQPLADARYQLKGEPAAGVSCSACVSQSELDFDPATQSELDTHKSSGDHDSRYFTESELQSPGTINDPSNPVDWTKLKGVPSGFADGTDDVGTSPPAWLLAGNLGTNPATDFVGTTDDTALNFRVNNLRALRLEPNAMSPNVIGGFNTNNAAAGVFGAAIGGGGLSGGPNRVTDNMGTVGGGQNNQAGNGIAFVTDATAAFVGGGVNNVASAAQATIGGGGFNTASDVGATVAGGTLNTATNDNAVVGGGAGNDATAQNSTIAGGNSNDAMANFSTIGGGQANDTLGAHSTAGGGLGNVAASDWSTVGGGRVNNAAGAYSTIAGGGPSTPADSNTRNRVTDDYGTIGGGGNNQAGDNAGTTTDRTFATVAGGRQNTASGSFSGIIGGLGNTAGGFGSVVGGGSTNNVIGDQASIVGGTLNTAGGNAATIGGGEGNTTGEMWATIPGGRNNSAVGAYSYAAGRQAKANHQGAFVWADSNAADMASSANNQFIVRAAGGIFLQNDSTLDSQTDAFLNTSTGAFLTNGGTWTNASSEAAKESFIPVDSRQVLDRVAELPIATWSYRVEDSSVRHMGPVSEDFRQAFGLGADDKSIATVDADGVALAAIQGLNQEVEDLRTELTSGGASAPSPLNGLLPALGLMGVAMGIALVGRRAWGGAVPN